MKVIIKSVDEWYGKQFCCDDCQKSFMVYDIWEFIEGENNNYHLNTNKKLYCPYCGKLFTDIKAT